MSEHCTECGRGPDPLLQKIPPKDLASERAFLGCCLLDPTTFGGLEVAVEPHWFADLYHAALWKAMQGLQSQGLPINAVSLAQVLRERYPQEEGEQVVADLMLARPLHELVDTVPSAVNANWYATQVRDAFLMRELAKVGRRITNLAWGEGTPSERLDQADRMLQDVAAHSLQQVNAAGPQKLMDMVWDRLERLRGGQRSGVATGYHDLDELLRGLQPGEFSLLAGRPSMGKTALAFSMLRRMARGGEPVGVVSLETPNEQVGINWLASVARIDSRALRDGYVPAKLPPSTMQAIEDISACEGRFHVADRGVRTVTDFRRLTRLWVARHGVKVMAVDYLQLLRSGAKGASRYDEVTEVSMALKAVAHDLGVHVLALAQLNRGVEQRQNKEPAMSDLKESGQLEQDADQIMLIHRPGYYDDEQDPGETRVRVAKNRNGATGVVELQFVREHNLFLDVDRRGQGGWQAP